MQLLQATGKTSERNPKTQFLMEHQMLLIRTVEERLQQLCLEGLAGDLHFSKGQEAICVGVCAALRETDYVCTHHRSIAHAIAKGVPLNLLLAEVLGKSTGMNGGMAGEMHMSCPAKRFMFSWQLVGTCIPVAAGMAWAVKSYLKTDDIVVVFHGDAATANGQSHEGVNIASVQELPLLLVCENNGLAGNVRSEDYLPAIKLEERAWGYGITSRVVDGNDLEKVYSAARDAVAIVRHLGAPFLLVCDTTRLGRHKQGQGDLRTKEEIAELALRDPLRNVTAEERAEMDARVEEIINRVMAEPDTTWEAIT